MNAHMLCYIEILLAIVLVILLGVILSKVNKRKSAPVSKIVLGDNGQPCSSEGINVGSYPCCQGLKSFNSPFGGVYCLDPKDANCSEYCDQACENDSNGYQIDQGCMTSCNSSCSN